MNNLKKIGLSALAGSLVAVSAHAADVSLSGGASVAVTSAFDGDKTGYYMNDSVTLTVSGETDSGLTVTTSLELDGDTGAGNSYDSKSIKIASDGMGTITYSGHGGDSVVGGWDDVMPTAYEEVFALTKKQAQMRARYVNHHKRPEPIIDISHQVKVRKCLRCNTSFESEGHHNRVCKSCKDLREWKSNYLGTSYSLGHKK